MKCKTPRNYLKGGKVRGPGTATSDSILARISNGEYVLPKAAVDLMGLGNLEAIRQAALQPRLPQYPGYVRGGPVSTLVNKGMNYLADSPKAQKWIIKNTKDNLIENVAGLSPGISGVFAGMSHSAPANSEVLDRTQTQEYQRAQEEIRRGLGNKPTPGLFGLMGSMAGPTPAQTVQDLEQQQAVYDEQYRKLTGQPSPTEQRMVRDMNRASGKGYRPAGYALGGPISGGLNFQDEQDPTATTFYPTQPQTTAAPVTAPFASSTSTGTTSTAPAETNAFGNDMTLANRMNAGADTLRPMREGPTSTTPQSASNDFAAAITKALQANNPANPANQANAAYQAARAKADPMEVASGRFDREYAPGMAAGGWVSQAQWEGLPRFKQGGYPSYFSGERGRPFYDFLIGVPKEEQQRREMANIPIKNEEPGVPLKGSEDAAERAKNIISSATPTSAATLTAPIQESSPYNARRLAEQKAVRPLMGSLADTAALVRAAQTESLFNKGKMAATDYANQSPGRTVLDVLPTDTREGQSVVAAPSRQIGIAQYNTGQLFEPSQGRPSLPQPAIGAQRIMSSNGVAGPVTMGGSAVPRYQTDYTVFGPKGQQGTLSVTGPNQRVGGGTVSQPDQGNGGTVEGNVAALNRQYEALKSRNEAYGYGGGAAGSALPAAPAPVDIWARPGDSFGDSQMRQNRYEGLLQEAARQQGLGGKQRAAALMEAAQSMIAPGLGNAKLNAEQVQGGQTAALEAAKLYAEAAKSQTSALANAQKAEQEQKNKDREFNLQTTQAEIDAYAKNRNISMEQAKHELEVYKVTNPQQSDVRFPNLTGDFYSDPLKPGQPRSFDYKGVANRYGIQPASPDGKGMIPGEPRYLENGDVITVDAQGALIPFSGGWEGAAYQKWKEMQKR